MFGVRDSPRAHARGYGNIALCEGWEPEPFSMLSGAYLGSKVEISGLHREEQLDIPLLALRESIVNAICHRDYAMQGSQSKIEVFADRVEVISPGTLPTGIAVADLGLGASEIRNRQIVKIFRKAGYIEQLGTGIIRMRESCRDADLAEPRFEEVGSYFKKRTRGQANS